MYRYRLKSFTLNDGSAPLPLGNLTVIVGPNNVGKSRALRDVLNICAAQQPRTYRSLVVTDVDWTMPTYLDDLREREKLNVYTDANGNQVLRSLDPNLAGERSTQVTGWQDANYSQLLTNKVLFTQLVGTQFIAHLNTQNRLQLVQQTGSPQQAHGQTSHLLHGLYFAGAAVESTIAAIIAEQFGLDIRLDYSGLSHMLFRVGKDLSMVPSDPREAARPFLKLDRLDDQGDGLRAFVGIMTALMAAQRDVFLIDEPEAFLHPPQATRMGELLAEYATNERQIVVATHSAEVLQGMLYKSEDATILRIGRIGDRNTFRVLDKEDLKTIASDPLLQSERVLDGIFSICTDCGGGLRRAVLQRGVAQAWSAVGRADTVNRKTSRQLRGSEASIGSWAFGVPQ